MPSQFIIIVFCNRADLLSRVSNWNSRLDGNHRKVIVMPIENAIARQDPIVHLLIALGADFDSEVRLGLVYEWNKDFAGGTYLDWVRNGIKNIDAHVARLQSTMKEVTGSEEPSDLDLGSADDWKVYIAKTANDTARARFIQTKASQTDTPDSYKERQKEEARNMLRHKEYLQGVEALFVSLNARSVLEVKVDKPRQKVLEKTKSASYSYSRDGTPNRWGSHNSLKVAPSAVPFYDELFQAVWDSDHGRIQELCLPKEGSKREPLQITVRLVTKNGAACKLRPFAFLRNRIDFL